MKHLKDMTAEEFHDAMKAVGDMIQEALPPDADWNFFVIGRGDPDDQVNAIHSGNCTMEEDVARLLGRTRLVKAGLWKEKHR